MGKIKKNIIKKPILYILLIMIILLIIDYFNLPSHIGINLNNFNLDFINLMIIVLIFIFTYLLIDSRQIEKEKNKTSVCILIMINSYKECISNVDMMTDDIFSIVMLDFDHNKLIYENKKFDNLQKSPFKNEEMLSSLLAQGQIDINKYEKYLEIKSAYLKYFSSRAVFPDCPDLYNSNKEKFLKITKNEINDLYDNMNIWQIKNGGLKYGW